MIHKQKKVTIIIIITEVLPKKQGVQAPHRHPQPRGPEVERQDPRKIGFEGQWDFLSGKLEEDCGKWWDLALVIKIPRT